MRSIAAWLPSVLLILACAPVFEREPVQVESESAPEAPIGTGRSTAAATIDPAQPPVFVEAEPAPPEASDHRYTASLGNPTIQGDIDRGALARFAKREHPQLARCAELGQGSVEVRYLIGDGRLLRAKLESSTASDAAARCVIAAIEGWDGLPEPSCSIVVVTQRITLRAE